MTFDPSWKTALRQVIHRHKARAIAVVGVGNDLLGDDAVGVLVVRDLRESVPESPLRLIVDGGTAPENYAERVRQFTPGLLILVDAVQMGQPPGTVRLLVGDDITETDFPAHSTSMTVFLRYVAQPTGCEVVAVGVQPGTFALAAPVTAVCAQAARDVAAVLTDSLRLP